MKILIVLLSVLGVGLLFDLNIKSGITNILTLHKKKQTLADYKKAKLNLKKQNFLTRPLYGVKSFTGKQRFNSIKIRCFALACALFLVSISIKNYFAAPVLALMGYMVPLWVAKYGYYREQKYMLAELETTVSVITSSYLRTENIIEAVEENISFVKEPIKQHFEKFLTEAQYINADVDSAIQGLKSTSDNAIFREWCITLRRCNVDSSLKASLLPCVAKFSNAKDIQLETNTIMRSAFFDFLCLVGMTLGTLPALWIMNKRWFNSLIYTSFGQFLIALLFTVILVGMNKAITLLEPVEIRG